jgi:hypothetical protein
VLEFSTGTNNCGHAGSRPGRAADVEACEMYGMTTGLLATAPGAVLT